MVNLCKLTPHISTKIWGGTKLSSIKNIETTEPVGETWEVSTLEEGSSLIATNKLSSLCSLTYLVKFIDTADNLSIQVHPDDEYAKEHENSMGKTECWYILDADDEAGIYLGFKKGITKKEFFNAVAAGLAVDKFLNFIPVKKGDFFIVPAGSVHAIGAGVTLCEVQQNSGVTYRVWDWNRVGSDGVPRELHIEKSKDVLNFNQDFNDKLISSAKKFSESGVFKLIEHRDFKAEIFNNLPAKELTLKLKAKQSIIVLEGKISGDIVLEKFESAICLNDSSMDFQIEQGTSFILVD